MPGIDEQDELGTESGGAPEAELPLGRWAQPWRALAIGEFRWLEAGQLVSGIGTWMTRVAVAWMVLRLTNSVLWLGVVGFTGQIPVLLLAPWTGSAIDRRSRRKILLAAQVLSSLQALSLAALTFTHHIGIGWIVGLSLVRGAINAFDAPARTSLLPQLATGPRDHSALLALDSVVVNLCRVAGPALAGLLVAARGEGICFLIDAASYAASFSTLLAMREPAGGAADRSDPCRREESWQWLKKNTAAGSALLLLCLTSLLALPFTVLLPYQVKNVLHEGAAVFGLLGTASSVGALAALGLIASLCDSGAMRALGRAGMAGSGVALLGLAVARSLPATIAAVALVSFCIMLQIASTNVQLQATVDERLRGRITVLYSAAFGGMVPIGSLLLGTVARFLGCPAAFAMGGGLCLLAVVVSLTLGRAR